MTFDFGKSLTAASLRDRSYSNRKCIEYVRKPDNNNNKRSLLTLNHIENQIFINIFHSLNRNKNHLTKNMIDNVFSRYANSGITRRLIKWNEFDATHLSYDWMAFAFDRLFQIYNGARKPSLDPH